MKATPPGNNNQDNGNNNGDAGDSDMPNPGELPSNDEDIAPGDKEDLVLQDPALEGVTKEKKRVVGWVVGSL